MTLVQNMQTLGQLFEPLYLHTTYIHTIVIKENLMYCSLANDNKANPNPSSNPNLHLILILIPIPTPHPHPNPHIPIPI